MPGPATPTPQLPSPRQPRGPSGRPRSRHAALAAALATALAGGTPTQAGSTQDPEARAARPAADDDERSPTAQADPLMPDFRIPALDGSTVDSAKLRGKVVLLDIWATWCAPCKVAAPDIDRMYRELRGRGLEVVGIAVQSGSAEQVRRAARQHRMSYPVALWNEDLAERFRGLTAVPTYILADRSGAVRQVFVGATPTGLLRKEILALLGPAGGSTATGKAAG